MGGVAAALGQPAPPAQNSLIAQAFQQQQTTIPQDITALAAKLQIAPLAEQQQAEQQLADLLQQLHQLIQAQVQFQEQMNANKNSTFYMKPQLCDQNVYQRTAAQPTVQLAPEQQQVIRRHLPFMCDEVQKEMDLVFNGINAVKITRVTLDKQQRFFWIQGIDSQFKLFWSNEQDQPAIGSLTLRNNIRHLLIGKPAHDYVKCKLDLKSLAQVHEPDFSSVNKSSIMLYLTIICDKRDINIIFSDVDDLEVWAAALIERSGCTSIYCE